MLCGDLCNLCHVCSLKLPKIVLPQLKQLHSVFNYNMYF